MNPKVAAYWKEHFDLRYYMEKNWYSLGPKLQGEAACVGGRRR